MEVSTRQMQQPSLAVCVFRCVRLLILLLTWVGICVRAADVPLRLHEAHQDICDHSHGHHDEEEGPCDDHHHHCHCPSMSPLFCLPDFPAVAGHTVLLIGSAKSEQIQWGLPDEPVYAPEVPPVIS